MRTRVQPVARPRESLSFLPGRHLLGIRNGPNYIAGRLVLSNAVKDYMAKEVVVRPGQVGDLDNHLRPDPMHATERAASRTEFPWAGAPGAASQWWRGVQVTHAVGVAGPYSCRSRPGRRKRDGRQGRSKRGAAPRDADASPRGRSSRPRRTPHGSST